MTPGGGVVVVVVVVVGGFCDRVSTKFHNVHVPFIGQVFLGSVNIMETF